MYYISAGFWKSISTNGKWFFWLDWSLGNSIIRLSNHITFLNKLTLFNKSVLTLSVRFLNLISFFGSLHFLDRLFYYFLQFQFMLFNQIMLYQSKGNEWCKICYFLIESTIYFAFTTLSSEEFCIASYKFSLNLTMIRSWSSFHWEFWSPSSLLLQTDRRWQTGLMFLIQNRF